MQFPLTISRVEVRLLITIAAIAVLPMQVRAADVADPDGPPRADSVAPGRFGPVGEYLSGWNVVLGGGVMVAPKYEGSDEFEVLPVPFVSATFGDRVTVDPRGISVGVYSTDSLNLSASVGYDGGRSEDDSDHLRGLGDIDGGAKVGVKLGYEIGPLNLYTSLDRTFGGSDGLTGKVGADVSHSYERFLFSAGLSATWGDDNYMQSYFGVTPDQSARSGLAQYDIGAGFKRVDIQASIAYVATENWLVRGQVKLGYLVGDVADSPIVQDELQPSAMLLVGYKF